MIMISLYNTLKESLLGGFDKIEVSMNPKKEIKQFIKDNYRINGRIKISKEPNENGKYEVSCKSAKVVNNKITSLTNSMFEWGEISGRFNCYECPYLKTLEGAPKEVGKDFNCAFCDSLVSLKGCPEKVGRSFICDYCESLKSLEGAPEEVGWDFSCYNCGENFTEEDVKKVCNVKNRIYAKNRIYV